MEEANYSQAYYVTVNTIFLIVAISVIVTLAAIGNHFAFLTSEKARSNTTVVQSDDVDQTYTGVTRSNIEVYDGIISGENVYNDIVNGDKAIPITLNNDNLMLLPTMGYTSYQYYIQNYNPSVLITDGRLTLNRNYKRLYIMDTNGTITAVRYIVQ